MPVSANPKSLRPRPRIAPAEKRVKPSFAVAAHILISSLDNLLGIAARRYSVSPMESSRLYFHTGRESAIFIADQERVDDAHKKSYEAKK